jgi:hypothetical protein
MWLPVLVEPPLQEAVVRRVQLSLIQPFHETNLPVGRSEESRPEDVKMPALLRLILLSCIFLLQGCATTRYEQLAEARNEDITQLTENSFRVEYRVRPFTSQGALDDFLRKRCAEVTLREGYDYFAMTKRFDTLMYQRSSSVTVLMFKGRGPSDRLLFFDARDVLDNRQN